MLEKIKATLVKIRPMLGGTEIVLVDLNGDTVKVNVLIPGCAAGLPEEMAIEIFEDLLEEDVPEIKKVIVV